MDRREAKEIVDWVIAEIYKNRFSYVTDGRLDLSKSHIGTISGTQTYGGPIAAGAIWDRHVQLNADIAGTKVRQATTSERGTVRLDNTPGGTDGEVLAVPTSNVMYDHGVAVSGIHGVISEIVGVDDVQTLTNKILDGVKWSLTVHAADVDHRGFTYFVEGGIGVADKLYIIMKSAGDTYSAIQVAIG